MIDSFYKISSVDGVMKESPLAGPPASSKGLRFSQEFTLLRLQRIVNALLGTEKLVELVHEDIEIGPNSA